MKKLRIVAAGLVLLVAGLSSFAVAQTGIVFIPPITPGDCAKWQNINVLADAGSGCGGTGSPGGLPTQVQFNSSGNFAGITGVTSDGNSEIFINGALQLSGSFSGASLLNAPATGGGALTLPPGKDTVTGDAAVQTLTNKSIDGSTNTLTNIANASLTNSAITIAGHSVSLGGSLTAATLTPSLSVATSSSVGVVEPDNTTITVNGSGVISATGAVASVSNSNGSLTISPTTGAVVASLNLSHANTWAALQTYTNSDIALLGSSTGATTLTSDNTTSTSYTAHLPAANDTIALLAAPQTFASKTLTTPTINGGSISGTISGAATLSGNLTFTGSNAYGTPASLTLTNATGLNAATGLTGIVPSANGGAGSITGIMKATSGVTAAAVIGTDYAAPGAVDLVPSSVGSGTMGTRFSTQNIEDITGAAVTLTYPASTTLLANGANLIYAIGGTATIAIDGSDELCTPTCGSAGVGGTISSGNSGVITTDQAGHLYLSTFLGASAGGGFPIVLGSTSIASSSTTTSIAGLTLTGPTFTGTVAGSPTASGAWTFSGSNAYGTPASITLTNGTGLPIGGITGLGTGVGTALAAGVTGSGNFVLAGSPSLSGTIGGNLTFSGSNAYGTPASINLTNGASLPISGIASLGTGVGTLLGDTATGTGGLVGYTSPTLSGTIGGALTFSGAMTLSSTLTAASLATSGTISGAICTDASGHIIANASTNCFTSGGGPAAPGYQTGVEYGVAPGEYGTQNVPVLAGTVYYMPMIFTASQAWTKIGLDITALSTGTCDLGAYANSGALPTGSPLFDTSVVATSTGPYVKATITWTPSINTLYWGAIQCSAAPTIVSASGGSFYDIVGASGGTAESDVLTKTSQTGSYGTPGSSLPTAAATSAAGVAPLILVER